MTDDRVPDDVAQLVADPDRLTGSDVAPEGYAEPVPLHKQPGAGRAFLAMLFVVACLLVGCVGAIVMVHNIVVRLT